MAKKSVTKKSTIKNAQKPTEKTPKSLAKINLRQTYVPILVIFLLVASFLLGALYTKISYLEKGPLGSAPSTAQPQTGPNVPNKPGAKVDVSVGHLPVLGNKNAKVTVIEFADLRCPFCEQWFKTVEGNLINDYVKTDKVKFAFRHYAFLGPASTLAANAVECANEQGKFWELHDYLYKNQPPETDTSMYTVDNLTQTAGTLGLNTDQFRSCLSANKYNDNVSKDLSDGQKAGVNGTPATFVNGQLVVGAQPYSAFKTIIDQELSK